jgi:hypothetical protein
MLELLWNFHQILMQGWLVHCGGKTSQRIREPR